VTGPTEQQVETAAKVMCEFWLYETGLDADWNTRPDTERAMWLEVTAAALSAVWPERRYPDVCAHGYDTEWATWDDDGEPWDDEPTCRMPGHRGEPLCSDDMCRSSDDCMYDR
jgi:hypothetical protein